MLRDAENTMMGFTEEMKTERCMRRLRDSLRRRLEPSEWGLHMLVMRVFGTRYHVPVTGGLREEFESNILLLKMLRCCAITLRIVARHHVLRDYFHRFLFVAAVDSQCHNIRYIIEKPLSIFYGSMSYGPISVVCRCTSTLR